MEPKDLYDLFFIAIIAIVLARWIKRRQAAEEKRRERELDSAVQAPGVEAATGAEPPGEEPGAGVDAPVSPPSGRADDAPAETHDRDPDDRARPG
jgi:hypothetical protein